MSLNEFAQRKWGQIREWYRSHTATPTGVSVFLMAIVIFGLAVNQTRMPDTYPPSQWLKEEYYPTLKTIQADQLVIMADLREIKRTAGELAAEELAAEIREIRKAQDEIRETLKSLH